MAIKIEPLRKAFALANRLADNHDIDIEQRENYRSLESLIWTASGRPKSRSLIPSLVTRILAGFRSECVMPFRCAASRASRIWPAYSTALRAGRGPRN